jgi:orotidine-5'-phosphate decarboxylase
MSDISFQQKYEKIILKNNSLLCVGLDTEFAKLSFSLKVKPETAMFEFNKAIIESTNHLVCAYKLNSAFYEAEGDNGIKQLKDTCDLLRYSYPDIPVILDAKRGDIGHTNEQYVRYAFDYLGVDAITLHPYLGRESLQPFLNIPNKGSFILCRTSNEGAGELQDMVIEGQTLYQKVASKVAGEWNENNNCMLVVGATYPKEIEDVRKMVGDMILLVPGVGAQQGDLLKIIKAGMNSKTHGLIISASRSVIYASTDSDFFIKAREAAEKLKNEINAFREGRASVEQKEEQKKEEEQKQEQPPTQSQPEQPTQNPVAAQAQKSQEPLHGAQAILSQLAEKQKADEEKQKADEERKKAEEEKAKAEEKANPFGKPFEKAQVPEKNAAEHPKDDQEKPKGPME